jgi:exonuclease SbcC
MIELQQINIEGFGSITGPFFYALNKQGINVISGDNGSGKTTMFSAVCWALYGKTLKPAASITPWEDRRSSSFQGTKVELDLLIEGKVVKIIRCKDYSKNITTPHYKVKGGSKTFIFIDGELLTLRDKGDVQAKIEEMLGMSFNLFKNSISFGQNLTRLLRETGPKQKDVFDEAFETTYINRAKQEASKKLSELQKESDKQEASVELLEEKLKSINLRIENLNTTKYENQERLEEVEKTIEEIEGKLKKHKATRIDTKELFLQIKKAKKEIEPLKEASNEAFKKDLLLTQEEAELKGLKDAARRTKESLAKRTPICNSCGQEIKGKDAEKHRVEHAKKLEQDLKRIKALTISTQKSREEYEVLKKSEALFIKLEKNLKNLEKEYSSKKNNKGLVQELKDARLKAMGTRDQLRLKIVNLQKEADDLLPDKDKLADKLAEESSKLKNTQKQVELHKWLISDPFSNKGLKAFIFNLMLSSINDRLEYYSQFLGYLVHFSIDLGSAHKNFEVRIYQKKQTRQYEDLSGGQQQLVDICLAFSIHDVVTESKKINLLLMDEVFESLDSNNIELVSELLQLKSESTSLHLITHQQNLSFYKVAQHLHLKLQQGTTKVSLT